MNTEFLIGIFLLLVLPVAAFDKPELREEFDRYDTDNDGLLDGN